MKLFAGVDGGGSKTLAVVVNENGQEVGRGIAANSNYQVIASQGYSLPEAANLAAERVAEALRLALPKDSTPVAIFAGLAGADRPADLALLLPSLAQTKLCPLEQWQVVNDAELILYGLDGGIGIGLISGTGSIAVGRDGNIDGLGKKTRAGGWGYIFGDEGSGYAIGQAALQAAAKAFDVRSLPTLLLPRILEAWQLTSPDQLIGAIYGTTEGRNQKIAQLASLVFATARDGDKIAQIIAAKAAKELASAVHAVYLQLTFHFSPALGLGGGLLLNTPELQQGILKNLAEWGWQPRQVVPVPDAALAAALACLQAEG